MCKKSIPKPQNSQRKTRAGIFYWSLMLPPLLSLFLPAVSPAFETDETAFCSFFYTKKSSAVKLLMNNADLLAREVFDNIGFTPKQKVRVFVAAGPGEFRRMQPGNARVPSWAVGTAYPLHNTMVLLQDRRVDLFKTFLHEMHHIVLGRLFRGEHRVPRWLDEGLAMIQAREWSMARLSTMTIAVLTDSLIPMDDLADSFPVDLKDAEVAYCQSFYFISFLKGKFGTPSFTAFLKEYGRHKNFHRAIKKTYYVSWHRMEELWMDYLKLRFSWFPILTSTGFLWFAASIVFVLGYIRKKRTARRKLQQWEREEKAFYGDDETYH